MSPSSDTNEFPLKACSPKTFKIWSLSKSFIIKRFNFDFHSQIKHWLTNINWSTKHKNKPYWFLQKIKHAAVIHEEHHSSCFLGSNSSIRMDLFSDLFMKDSKCQSFRWTDSQWSDRNLSDLNKNIFICFSKMNTFLIGLRMSKLWQNFLFGWTNSFKPHQKKTNCYIVFASQTRNFNMRSDMWMWCSRNNSYYSQGWKWKKYIFVESLIRFFQDSLMNRLFNNMSYF